jgi:hypothetical protein
MMVFENRVQRSLYGPERDELKWEWRRLHNEKLYALHPSPNNIWMIKSRRMKWAGHVACTREKRGAYRVLVGRPEGRKPHGRYRRRWEDIIKMIRLEVDWGGGYGQDISGSG